ncbi:putative cytochrome p450 family protein [Phaeomoniella chlamydospora]|uniref:Putative cytochrome p450 family protein n=1 Tax=Phaeomoniella chlamydospora TaxID=158046 RepID=A0A0G2E7S3_PHACM|nr:putative cytochrome p450 family protein [Phaeomoniella chlamydospora]
MRPFILAPLFALGLFVLYKAVTIWLIRRRNAQEARRRGCLPPPSLPLKGFLGFGTLIESVRATKPERGPQYVVETLNKELGKDVHTCKVPISDYELTITRDPVNVQAMLATQSYDWDVGQNRLESWKPLFGPGVFVSRGESWKHYRALVRPQFARDQINDLDLIERHVQQLFKALDQQRDRTKEKEIWTRDLDLYPYFANLTLDVNTELLYGYSVHSQNPSERFELPYLPGHAPPDHEHIGHHIHAGKEYIETRGALWKYRWLLPTREGDRHCEAVQRYANYFVQLRLTQGEKYLSSLPRHLNATQDRFVLLNELARHTQNPSELRGETLNILLAGRDASAAFLGWIFYFLSRHPAVFSKLRSQILELYGPYTASKPITSQSLRSLAHLPYLTAIINETIRIAPVIPLNERVALNDTTLPRGGGPDHQSPIFIPKGQQVLIPTYALQQRSDLWGPDVNQFKPERWENRKFGFEFIPFGGGVRQCLGQQFARTVAAYVVVRVCQRFDVFEAVREEGEEETGLRFHHTIENRSGRGTWVRLRLEGV